MAHLIEKNIAVYHELDGKGWHKIGTEIDGIGVDECVINAKAAQPLLLAKFAKHSITVGEHGTHPTQSAIVRLDDGRICGGTVGTNTFNVPQPRDMYIAARDILKDFPDAYLSFSCMMSNGKFNDARHLQCWNIGKFEIAGEEYTRFLIIHIGIDGCASREIMISATRAVCNNTLQVARYNAKGKDGETDEDAAKDARAYAKIRNTKNADKHQANAVNHMRDILSAFDKMKERGEKLTKVKINTEQAAATIDRFLKKRGKDMEKSKQARTEAEKIMALYFGEGIELKQHTGTAYGLEQALSEYNDHHVTVAGEKKDPLKRIDHVLFRGGAKRRGVATAVINELMEQVGVTAELEREPVTAEDLGLAVV